MDINFSAATATAMQTLICCAQGGIDSSGGLICQQERTCVNVRLINPDPTLQGCV